MSVQYNETASMNSNGSNPVSGTSIDVGNNDLSVNLSIAANQTGLATNITFNGANLQAIILVASQNLELQINSTSTPFATINLKAGIPYTWSASAGYFANPLNTNVTQIYVTSTTACQLKGKVLTT